MLAAKTLVILILTGQSDLPYHDWQKTTPFFESILKAAGGFQVRVATAPPASFDGYDSILLNYNGPRWGAATEAAIEKFIRSGKGMVAIHGVSYGEFIGHAKGPNNRWVDSKDPNAGWKGYVQMIGTGWDADKIGHAPRHVFTVKVTDSRHPVMAGVPVEFTTDDELYHRMALLPGIHVLATAFDDPAKGGTGKDEPVAWTVAFGKGRVFHTTLGHDLKALDIPAVRRMLVQAARWTATGR